MNLPKVIKYLVVQSLSMCRNHNSYGVCYVPVNALACRDISSLGKGGWLLSKRERLFSRPVVWKPVPICKFIKNNRLKEILIIELCDSMYKFLPSKKKEIEYITHYIIYELYQRGYSRELILTIDVAKKILSKFSYNYALCANVILSDGNIERVEMGGNIDCPSFSIDMKKGLILSVDSFNIKYLNEIDIYRMACNKPIYEKAA